MRQDGEQFAVMGMVRVGCRDTNSAMMWFNVTLVGGCGSLLCMSLETAAEHLTKAAVVDIDDLEGTPCVVRVSNDHVTFVRFV